MKRLEDELRELAALPPENLPEFLATLKRLEREAQVRLLQSASNGTAHAHQQDDDRLLDVTEASKRMAVSEDYMYRNAKKLPFVVRVGRGLRFSSKGIDDYIRRRQRQRI